MKNHKTLLVVAAHPDDEILGCGGTAAKLIKEGFKAYSLILGEGITSRDGVRNVQKRYDELTSLQKDMQKANKTIGITKVFSYQFPDNRFDSVPILDIVKKIEEVLRVVSPSIVFTHYLHDLNIDHQITNQAVLTATRPLVGQRVKKIYAFETLSSTEFNYPLSFSPDTFVEISTTLKQKVKAMDAYQSEVRPFPHPRSLNMIEKNAEYWGIRTGLKKAEAFQTLRNIW